MHKSLLFLMTFFLFLKGTAQTRDTSWANLEKIETEFYSIEVPIKWINLGKQGNIVDQSFDATNVYFVDSFNNAPILAGYFVINQPAENLEDAKDKCLKGYSTNEDRKFPKGLNNIVEKIHIASGEEAYIIHTYFYRESKKLNQSRYDLVVYSKKARQGFLVTVSVQYKDDSYLFEYSNKLEGFAKRLYSFFNLK